MGSLIYTGIGSRRTPQRALLIMQAVGRRLAEAGWILRSGGAEGADSAFEMGCDQGKGRKEIYLPWPGFNGKQGIPLSDIRAEVRQRAFKIAGETHPNPAALSPGAFQLHARNVLQVLGGALDTPSKVLICWTKGGRETGGTRTAMVLAGRHSIPIINIYNLPPENERFSDPSYVADVVCEMAEAGKAVRRSRSITFTKRAK